MRFAMLLVAVVALFVPSRAMATFLGPRQIVELGCHAWDNTCFVTISGDAVGPAACRGNSLRWNTQSSPGGKNLLSLLTSAFLAGKAVRFDVVDTTCYADQPAFPTFTYAQLQ